MAVQLSATVSHVRCSRTGRAKPINTTRPLALCGCCPAPGSPLTVQYDGDAVAEELAQRPLAHRTGAGIWRYAPMLPVTGVPAGYAEDVGLTPIIEQPALGEELEVELLIKNEGANPSGSFKDRGLAVGVALGAALGAQRFCLPTQGNAGVAAALFSRRLGLPPCVVRMPQGYQDSVYHRQAAFFGASVAFNGANIGATGKAMREELAGPLSTGEVVDLSTFFEPGRLEGKKTMGLEIFENLGADGLPDCIVYPTGGGTGLVGIWKAFEELRDLGLLAKDAVLPKMVAVQSDQCDPVVRAFDKGLDHVQPIVSKGTVADGLDVPGAIMGHGILRTLRESAGRAVAVSEAEIRESFTRMGRCGVTAGYESAATLAAAARLRRDDVLSAGSRVLLLVTGSHLIPMGQR